MNKQEAITYLKKTPNSWAIFDGSGQCWLGEGFPCCTPGYKHKIDSYEDFRKIVVGIPKVSEDLYSFFGKEMQEYLRIGSWEAMGLPHPSKWTENHMALCDKEWRKVSDMLERASDKL
jgi:hypothetical protein